MEWLNGKKLWFWAAILTYFSYGTLISNTIVFRYTMIEEHKSSGWYIPYVSSRLFLDGFFVPLLVVILVWLSVLLVTTTVTFFSLRALIGLFGKK